MTQAHSLDGAGKAPGPTANGGTGQRNISEFGQIVLVLQGGGALGAYQAGVYQALHEAGIEPDWVIGTSIGAINASLIAGNKPEHRLAKLEEFWNRVGHNPALEAAASIPGIGRAWSNWMTLTTGIPAFFKPNPLAFLGQHVVLPVDAAGYYSTQPLEATLSDLVDFPAIRGGPTRLTVGAANIQTGEMRYFDSRDTTLTVRHVMASGALPPAFPAVRIDGELYWDGGVVSNTPVEAVFDDNPRRNSLVFAVHMWNPDGPEPDTVSEDSEPPEGHPIFKPRRQPHQATEADSSLAAYHRRTRHALAGERTRKQYCARNGGLWMPDPHACCPASRPPARRGGPYQGYRLQPPRYPLPVGGRSWRCAPRARRRAVGSGGRSDRGFLSSRMPPGDRSDGMSTLASPVLIRRRSRNREFSL